MMALRPRLATGKAGPHVGGEVSMSEPYAAFVKLRIDRPKLVRWLNAPIASPTRWEDWRKMGGQYYSEGGVKELSDYSDSGMLHCLAECDARLSGCRDNRSALRAIMETANPPELKRASYRADTRRRRGRINDAGPDDE